MAKVKPIEILQFLVEDELITRDLNNSIYKKRVQQELISINLQNLSKYVLLLHSKGMKVNNNSLVFFLLGLCDCDPIIDKKELSVSRYPSFPDVDTDFDTDGKDRVVQYFVQKFGKDSVAPIGAYGQMQIRMVIKDIARVFDIDVFEVNEITKYLGPEVDKIIDAGNYDHYADIDIRTDVADPNKVVHVRKSDGVEITPDDQYQFSRDIYNLEKFFEKYKQIKELVFMLKGQIRHASKHAAGVVAVPGSITNQIPLMKHKGELITAWVDGIYRKDLQNLGFIKFDILGLKTLTVIKKALELIKETGSYKEKRGDVDFDEIDWNLNQLPFNDEQLYLEFGRANTTSVFQFKSDGMKALLRYMKPGKFDDIVAATALFRPGPKDVGMEIEFCKRKKHKDWENKFPGLDDIFKDTYGIIVYQEQVMMVGHLIAGFTLDETDDLRKVLVKRTRDKKAASKIKDKVEIMRDKFIIGCMKNKKYEYTKKLAQELYDMLCSFSRYGFNRCIFSVSKVFIVDNNNIVKPITIEQLYKIQENTNLFALSYNNLEDKFVKNEIRKVYKTGKKMLYKVKTKSGKEIITTLDHKYMTSDDSYKRLKNLHIGDKIKVIE